MIPIKWNNDSNEWEVMDQNGKVLWRGTEYSDAAQFAEDYMKQIAFQQALTSAIRG